MVNFNPSSPVKAVQPKKPVSTNSYAPAAKKDPPKASVSNPYASKPSSSDGDKPKQDTWKPANPDSGSGSSSQTRVTSSYGGSYTPKPNKDKQNPKAPVVNSYSSGTTSQVTSDSSSPETGKGGTTKRKRDSDSPKPANPYVNISVPKTKTWISPMQSPDAIDRRDEALKNTEHNVVVSQLRKGEDNEGLREEAEQAVRDALEELSVNQAARVAINQFFANGGKIYINMKGGGTASSYKLDNFYDRDDSPTIVLRNPQNIASLRENLIYQLIVAQTVGTDQSRETLGNKGLAGAEARTIAWLTDPENRDSFSGPLGHQIDTELAKLRAGTGDYAGLSENDKLRVAGMLEKERSKIINGFDTRASYLAKSGYRDAIISQSPNYPNGMSTEEETRLELRDMRRLAELGLTQSLNAQVLEKIVYTDPITGKPVETPIGMPMHGSTSFKDAILQTRAEDAITKYMSLTQYKPLYQTQVPLVINPQQPPSQEELMRPELLPQELPKPPYVDVNRPTRGDLNNWKFQYSDQYLKMLYGEMLGQPATPEELSSVRTQRTIAEQQRLQALGYTERHSIDLARDSLVYQEHLEMTRMLGLSPKATETEVLMAINKARYKDGMPDPFAYQLPSEPPPPVPGESSSGWTNPLNILFESLNNLFAP